MIGVNAWIFFVMQESNTSNSTGEVTTAIRLVKENHDVGVHTSFILFVGHVTRKMEFSG